jgi:cytochrome c
MMNIALRAHSRELIALLLVGLSTVLPMSKARPDAAVPGLAALGDASHGKQLYQACAACHSVEENDIGPLHRGVVGRRAGSVADYNYSAALKNSGILWDEAQLDRWLKNPSELVPGTKMFFKLDDAQMRADIIAYLKTQP